MHVVWYGAEEGIYAGDMKKTEMWAVDLEAEGPSGQGGVRGE